MIQSILIPTSSGGPNIALPMIISVGLVLAGFVFTVIDSERLMPRLIVAGSLILIGLAGCTSSYVAISHAKSDLVSMQAKALQSGWRLSHADALYLAQNPEGQEKLFGYPDGVIITLADGKATSATLHVQGDHAYLIDASTKKTIPLPAQ